MPRDREYKKQGLKIKKGGQGGNSCPPANFYRKGRKGSRNVRKGASSTFAIGYILCALCADIEVFVVKNTSKHSSPFFTKTAERFSSTLSGLAP
jgi:hypothetical protein